MNFLGFKAPVTVGVEFFKGGDVKPETVTVRSASGVPETVPLYTDGDTVSGVVTITPAFGKKVDHQGIKIELLGQIEAFYDKGSFYDFVASAREVSGPAELREEVNFDFEFPKLELLNLRCSGVRVELVPIADGLRVLFDTEPSGRRQSVGVL